MQNYPLPNIPCVTDAPKAPSANACIVCGTNLSASASQTVEVAGAFAKRLGERVVLVHAVNDQSRETLPEELRDSLALYARARLRDEQQRLHALPVETIDVLLPGTPDAVLLGQTAAYHARLLVVGSPQRRSLSRWLQADVTERVAESSRVPTLVVNNAEPLLQWTRGERRLRVFVAADFSTPSEAALQWVSWLRRVGSCDVVAAYLEPSTPVIAGGDVCSSPEMDEMLMKMARLAERSFRQRVRSLLGRSRVRVRFEFNLGLSDARLLQMAAEERADLVVVGTHSRRGWHRLGHHSVSRGVLRCASVNVACVPVPLDPPLELTPPDHLPVSPPRDNEY